MVAPQRTQRADFFIHIIRQLIGIFGVIVVAILIGMNASREGDHRGTLAETVGSTSLSVSDTLPPLPPSAIAPSEILPTAVTITWAPAADNVAVVGYRLYRNGQYLGAVTATNYTDSSVVPGGIYSYYVQSFDAAGNASQPSPPTGVAVPTGEAVPTPQSGATGQSVEFSVQPGRGVGAESCVGGVGMTDVFFFINPTDGGTIELAPARGAMTVVTTDHYALPNGSYTWRGVPKDGHPISGSSAGSFALNALCGDTTAQEPRSGSVTMSTASDIADGSSPDLYVGGIKITRGATLGGDVVAVLKDSAATRVTFMLIDGNGVRRAYGKTEGATLLPGTDIWSVRIKTDLLGNGAYQLSAITEDKSGAKQEVSAFDFFLSNAAPTAFPVLRDTEAKTGGVTGDEIVLPPRPTARAFVDEKPLTPGKETDAQEIELRVIAPLATDVALFSIGALEKKVLLGRAVKDDLLSLPGVDVWSYVWNTDKEADGTRRLVARAGYEKGDPQLSESLSIVLRHITKENDTPAPGVDRTSEENIVAPGLRISAENAERTLLYVTDPSLCTTREECAIYCGKRRGEETRCLDFARTEFSTDAGIGTFADFIAPEQAKTLLADEGTRKNFPDLPRDPSALRFYCANDDHRIVCQTLVTAAGGATTSLLKETESSIRSRAVSDRRIIEERLGARIFVDTDQDGVVDYDELNLYHTDPGAVDTDGDGFPDMKELLARTNPRGGAVLPGKTNEQGRPQSLDEYVAIDDPRADGTVLPNMLTVRTIATTTSARNNDDNTESVPSKISLRIEGKAPANSFVTLYIFSDPIVVTVKTDAQGNWTYTLDKELPDGTHSVYSAITDAGGRILAKSEPLPFVKTAQAVSVGSELPSSAVMPGVWTGGTIVGVVAAILGLFGLALSVLGLVATRRHRKKIPDIFESDNGPTPRV